MLVSVPGVRQVQHPPWSSPPSVLESALLVGFFDLAETAVDCPTQSIVVLTHREIENP